MEKIEITHDVFDIARRIKEIDEDYFILYDRRLMRFEVHNRRQRPNTLSLVLPYDRLDCRAIDKVLSTRMEVVYKQLAELEKFNENISAKRQRQTAEDRLAEGQELFRRFNLNKETL